MTKKVNVVTLNIANEGLPIADGRWIKDHIMVVSTFCKLDHYESKL